MKIQQLIDSTRVTLGLEARELMPALEEIARHIAPAVGLEWSRIVDALAERERLGSTSVGGGFAIPHCKIDGLDTIWVSVARFADGIDFGGADGEEERFLFVVLSPADQASLHLQVLSQIARLLKRADCRRDLLEARNVDAVVAAIRHHAEAERL